MEVIRKLLELLPVESSRAVFFVVLFIFIVGFLYVINKNKWETPAILVLAIILTAGLQWVVETFLDDILNAIPDFFSVYEIRKVALITDNGQLEEGTYNQLSWEGIQEYCIEHDIDFMCYQSHEDTTKARIEAVEAAVSDECDVVVVTGYKFDEVLLECQAKYSDVYFIGNAISAENFIRGGNTIVKLTDNTVCITHDEEQAGYLAGYAVVAEGYTELGFMGSGDVPSINRYGSGFLQGANAAAEDYSLSDIVTVKYLRHSADVDNASMVELARNWYETGTEVIFPVGGDYWAEVLLVTQECAGKIIGTDINRFYMSDCILTSATKDIKGTVPMILEGLEKGQWDDRYSGEFVTLGLDDGDYVGLPTSKGAWRFSAFSVSQYEKIKKELREGTRECRADGESVEYSIEIEWLGD